MKKFVFTLGRILDYRQSLLEKEKNTMAQIVARRNAAEDRLNSYKRQYEETAGELRKTTEAGTTVIEIQRLDLKLQSGNRKIEESVHEIEQIEIQVDAQREVVKEVSQQVRGLEKLKDKQRDEYDYESRKEEEERIAELISSKIARHEA